MPKTFQTWKKQVKLEILNLLYNQEKKENLQCRGKALSWILHHLCVLSKQLLLQCKWLYIKTITHQHALGSKEMSLSWTSIVSNFQYGNGGFFLVRSAKMLMTCSSSKTSSRQSIKDAANIFFFENIVQETQKDAKLWKLVLVLVMFTI